MRTSRGAVGRAAGVVINCTRVPVVAALLGWTISGRIAGFSRFDHIVAATRRTIVVVDGIASRRTTIIVVLALGYGLMRTGRGAIGRAAGIIINCTSVAIVAVILGWTGGLRIARFPHFDNAITTIRGAVIVFVGIAVRRTTRIVILAFGNDLIGAVSAAISRAADCDINRASGPIIAAIKRGARAWGIACFPYLDFAVSTNRGAIIVVVGIASLRTTSIVVFALGNGLIGAGRGAVVRAAGCHINRTSIPIITLGRTGPFRITGFAWFYNPIAAYRWTIVVVVRIAA